MKVLIITYFFPPLNSIASLRPYSWAKYLAQQGIDVTVLTVKKYPFDNDLNLPIEGFKVVEIPIPKPIKIISLGKLINFLNQKFSLGIYYKMRIPDETVRWIKPSFNWAKNYHWDVIISTAMPYTTHEIAYKLKKNQNCKVWVADWRDLFSENPIFKGLPIIKIIEKQKEKKFNQEANLITTVSQGLKNYWTKTTTKPVEIIYNGFFEEDYKIPNQNIYSQNKKITIFYSGSLYKDRFIEYFFEAIAELKKENYPKTIEFQLAGAYNIEKYLKNYNINYHYLGFLKREEVINKLFQVDFLFFPLEKEKDLPNWKGILTGKIFEYLGINLYIPKPVLVVGKSYDQEKIEILQKSGCCIFLENKQSVKDFFINYQNNKKFTVQPNKEFISFFSRKNQAKILLEKIKNIL